MIYRPKYFRLSELVCPRVMVEFGEAAWGFLDPSAVLTLDILRTVLERVIYVNDYLFGGILTQRGLRCNLCDLVEIKTTLGDLYLSPHVRGIAFDFDVVGMTAEDVRQWIIAHEIVLPVPVRLEAGCSWVHLDTMPVGGAKRVTLFNG